jgi:hypothetical protein
MDSAPNLTQGYVSSQIEGPILRPKRAYPKRLVFLTFHAGPVPLPLLASDFFFCIRDDITKGSFLELQISSEILDFSPNLVLLCFFTNRYIGHLPSCAVQFVGQLGKSIAQRAHS